MGLFERRNFHKGSRGYLQRLHATSFDLIRRVFRVLNTNKSERVPFFLSHIRAQYDALLTLKMTQNASDEQGRSRLLTRKGIFGQDSVSYKTKLEQIT